jgi:putative hydrolase of the HAD superfamily
MLEKLVDHHIKDTKKGTSVRGDGYSGAMRFRAITFDFWNTLYADERGGYDEVHEVRLEIFRRLISQLGGESGDEALIEAYKSGFGAYLEAWREGRHYGATDQVIHVLEKLDITPYDGLAAAATSELEEVGRQARLSLLPGAAETVPALAEAGVRLGLISDTGVTPGRVLRHFLERDGLIDYFDALSFSDETGYPKPDRRMFLHTLARLDTDPGEAAHVGDMPRTDIAGARAVGMTTVRFAASNDLDEPPAADVVIKDHRDLLPALERLLRDRSNRQG